MLLNHTAAGLVHSFDEPNLIALAGLAPVVRLAQSAGLKQLADQWITVANTGGDKGANPGAKIMSLVAGMAAGADSVDDMDLLRHGGMQDLFDQVYAPSTLGSYLRAFMHGHVKQLAAVSARFVANLAADTPLLVTRPADGTGRDMILVDVDDTVLEVFSPNKQGAGIGYNKIRGLNGLFGTMSTLQSPPLILGQQLRKGAAHSVRGADKLISDSLATAKRVAGPKPRILTRCDSAFYSRKVAKAVLAAGADYSVTVPLNPAVTTAISTIPAGVWTGIKYPNAIFDEDTGQWISDAEVAEIEFTAFSSAKQADQVPGRLVVRRIPELNATKLAATQDQLFATYRYHAFFTTVDADTLDTVAADTLHRQHAVIEQVFADLKAGPLAHMPSGKFQANAAWLVTAAITHNLLRAIGARAGGHLAKARTSSIRHKLVHIPARIARRARRFILHLPTNWTWAHPFTRLWNSTLSPPTPATP